MTMMLVLFLARVTILAALYAGDEDEGAGSTNQGCVVQVGHTVWCIVSHTVSHTVWCRWIVGGSLPSPAGVQQAPPARQPLPACLDQAPESGALIMWGFFGCQFRASIDTRVSNKPTSLPGSML